MAATVSVWLKLIVPLPDPKLITGGRKFPAVSLPPRDPKFRVPEEPACDAMMTALAETDPPLATVRVPSPASPIVRLLLLLQVDPVPVTSTLLLEAPAFIPRASRPSLTTEAPPSTTTLAPWELFPTERGFVPVFQEDPAPVRVMFPALSANGNSVKTPLASRVPPFTVTEEVPSDD